MSGLAFLFPGQGSQRPSMGAALKQGRPDLFERYLGTAARLSGLPLDRLCLEGSVEELTPTEIAQPALFALSVAVAEAASDAGLRPVAAAGHSLGEYSAACSAGAIDFAPCLELVCQRGRLMARAQAERPGTMAALGGLGREAVAELCREAAEAAGGVVVPANFNAPGQVVISGELEAVGRAVELASARGAESATVLRVGAAFHSPLMADTEREMAPLLQAAPFRDPAIPLVANVWAEPVTSAARLREALTLQISRPVLWEGCVRHLLGAGCGRFLEVGPGRVLAGLVRLTEPDAVAQAADGPERIAAFQRLLAPTSAAGQT